MAQNIQHPFIRSSIGIGGFFAAAFVPSVVPESAQPYVFWSSVAVMGGAVTWPYLLRSKSWYKKHIAWRLALNPPATLAALQDHERTTEPHAADPSGSDAASEPRFTPTIPVALPPDLFTDQARREFPYPYVKAVLKADMRQPQGTLEALEVGSPHKLTIVMEVRNDHTDMMTGCTVVLAGYEKDGVWHHVDGRLKVGSKVDFFVNPTQPRRFPILTRDISDVVTPEPFLLLTADQRLPLEENSLYRLSYELRSRYPLPTVVTVRLATGSGLAAEARIVETCVPTTGPAAA